MARILAITSFTSIQLQRRMNMSRIWPFIPVIYHTYQVVSSQNLSQFTLTRRLDILIICDLYFVYETILPYFLQYVKRITNCIERFRIYYTI